MQPNRKIYFGAGPAQLPEEVLKEASEAIIDFNYGGLSILEIPHRGKSFDNILSEADSLVKELCELGDQYHVLWLPGGGRLQFAMVPMNFLANETAAGYIDSGHWSAEAIKYAKYYGQAEILSSSKEWNYDRLPGFPRAISKDIAYLHLTTNNTIYGTQWKDISRADVPLIADMSSDIFGIKRNYKDYSLFYAVAQKNLGAAGATMVVIHDEMLKRIKRDVPSLLSYEAQVKANSVVNTPPVFSIYTSLLMLRWTKKKSLAAIQRANVDKATLLYNEVERNTLFDVVVSVKEHRSLMNVCFRAINSEIEKAFSDFCSRNGIVGLEGHRTVGGFRVSLYNAITIAEVEKLIAMMQEYERGELAKGS
ncbi:MAG TPA: 3-phosphoserine/phosphohydroxythreonine transaminase [Flavipsychrobacter sp.]|nr:3-phosphoserine/phosphohydroxythreonine transaminase [Flavipsychrobacter sp.]